MTFTALHRALGRGPEPFSNELIEAAVNAGVRETSDLDWKSRLPPIKGIQETDFPKDVAAMANSGGGIIVYGVEETQKAATARFDVGELSEGHERALRSAAITAISPPVFGLNVHHLWAPGNSCAVVVEVPASVEGPHLIYKNDYFGAPVRNDADTVWMKERQIEAMYRARFEERRHATEALDALFKEAAAGRNIGRRAWLIAVAHPRLPRFRERLTHDDALKVAERAKRLAETYGPSMKHIHPLHSVNLNNPRPGLRRWVFAHNSGTDWREAWFSIHHDGSVTLAYAVGGHLMSSGESYEGREIESSAIELAVADLMALARATAEATDNDEYDVRIGIEWAGANPFMILTTDRSGNPYRDSSIPLHKYTPVETSVNALEPAPDFHWHVHDLVRDCINQGGISNVQIIEPPPRADETQKGSARPRY